MSAQVEHLGCEHLTGAVGWAGSGQERRVGSDGVGDVPSGHAS